MQTHPHAESGRPAPTSTFVLDMSAIRARARSHIENGAVTTSYRADRVTVIRILNEALATEIVCTLRYKRHAITAPKLAGIAGEAIARELGGEPDYDPRNLLSRAHSEYVAGHSLTQMLQEDLVAERIAIEIYGEIVRYLGSDDPTTRRLMEDILAKEEEHAEELSDWLERLTTHL